MNIVYLVFGNKISNYQQVYFSIYTALARKNSEDKIIVVSENATLFNSFGNNIEVIPINRAIIKDWEGEFQFFWRVKIKALQMVANKYPTESILYLDGDTFFYKTLDSLRNRLNQGQNFMHLQEGKLSELKSKTEKLMWKQMKSKTYMQSFIDNNTAMWNAGLIGVSKKHFDCLDYTLGLNDAMCKDGVTRRLIEQFSFSVGLNKYSELDSADDIVGHYWGNKQEWNDMISVFINECFMIKLTLEQIIEKVKEMDIKKYPIWVKQSNTERKLLNFISKFYINKKSVFLKN